ncbi:MAG: hypothetical protein ACYCT9_08020 [Leptospirillum sp.]|jgi:hypothetical protein
MIASKTTSGNTISPERPAGRWTRVVSIFSKINLFLSFALLILLSGCGGGPDVTQATGHGILLATSQGLFNISFSSNGSSTLTSTTPIIAGGINAMVAVENASYLVNGPMLVTTNGTTLSAYAMTGGVPSSTGQPISTSNCSSFSSINSLAVTPDGKYLLATSMANEDLYIITLASGYPCTQTPITTYYPTSVAVECLQLNSSCQIFLTLSTSSTSVSPTTPEVLSWTETQPPGSPILLSDLTPSASSVIFDNETSYFYTLVTVSNNSRVYNVSVVTPLTATSPYASNVSYGNVPFSNPCLDPLGQTLYTPTSNGSVYSASVSTSGSIGSPQQIWSLSSNPSGVQISPITSCVAY